MNLRPADHFNSLKNSPSRHLIISGLIILLPLILFIVNLIPSPSSPSAFVEPPKQPALQPTTRASVDNNASTLATESDPVLVDAPVADPQPDFTLLDSPVPLAEDIDMASLPFDPAQLREQLRNQFQVREEGIVELIRDQHKAVIDEGKLTFEPASGDTSFQDSSVNITLSSASIAIGAQDLLSPSLQPETTVEGNLVTLDYGNGLVEEYVARDNGVEQRWRLENKPVTAADLTIRVEVETSLTVAVTAEGFIFQAVDPATNQLTPVIRYERPLAIDAAQQTLWGQTQARLLETTNEGHNRYQLIMTFPAEWLAKAQFPLLVDPLISGLLRLEQGSPAQNQQNIQIAYNPDDNEFLLVWQDYRNGNNWDIYAQRLDGDGALLGDNFVINSSSYHQDVPHVIYAPGQDRFLVAWRHYTSASQYDLYGQRLSGTGDIVGSAFAIATGPASTLQTPTDIVYNSQSNQFLVLWQDGRSGKLHVWGRHVSLTGSLGSEFQITSVASTDQRAGVGAYNASNHQYLVVWATSDSKILARRMTGSGVVTTTDTILLSNNTSIDTPDVVYLDNTTQYLAVWKDNRNAGISGSDIYGRLVTPAGSTNGSEFVISNHTASETVPRLTLSASGGAWVIWQRNNGATTGQDLYARELNSNGQLIGSLITVYESPYSPGVELGLNQDRPVVARNTVGDLVFAWQDDRTGNWDIYARLRLANGDIGGDFLAHPASGNQENVHIAFNTTANEYLVVWQDFRIDLVGWQVYGQRVSSDGALIGDNILINSAGTEPDVAYSSTSNDYLVVWTYNNKIMGQRVTASGTLSGSAYQVVLGLSKLALADQPAIVYSPIANLFLVTSRAREAGSNTIHKIVAQQTPGLYTSTSLVSQTNIPVAEPDVAITSDGSYLVVWHDFRNGTYGIFGRRLTSAGVLNGNDFPISDLYGDNTSPDVAWNSTASAFLVVWDNYAAGVSNFISYISGQRINTSGSLVGNALFLASTNSNNGDEGYVTNPGVTASDGKWLVVWQDASSAQADIKARTIRADGVLLAGQTIPLMVATGEQKNPVIVAGNLDYALLAWQDNREGSWDLYAALYQMDVSVSGLAVSNSSPTVFGNATAFNASVTAGTNVYYTWNFGDNTTGTGATPNHTYAQPGTYNATVTATNSDNLLTATTVVVVYRPAVANFSGTPVAGSIPLTVTFTNSSLYATSYVWQFGDGATSNVASPDHVYAQIGQYTVSLTAIGPYNTSVLTRTAYITATDAPIVGLAAFNSSPTISGDATLFTATITAGTNVSYTWNFGDNSAGTGITTTHTYTRGRVYVATVTASNATNQVTTTTTVNIVPRWQMVTTAHMPAASSEYALTYDANREVMVLYGGNATGWPYENSTWEFDGSDWAQATITNTPQAVYGMAMTYDANRELIVLFGGSNADDTALAETWEYGGVDWTQASPTSSPPARTGHTLVYDPTTQTVYLFGGRDGDIYYNDLWQYDGTTWTELSPSQSPSARAYHAFAYNPADNNFVLFGGQMVSSTLPTDLWVFDPLTVSWTEISSTGPVGRVAPGFVYDPALGVMVLVGGAADEGDMLLNDTWHYASQTGWAEAEPASVLPPGAYYVALFDPIGGTILLVTEGQTWIYQ
jgi:PKD repeat protein